MTTSEPPPRRGRPREGVVGAWMVVMMLSLIGMAALVIDIGRLIIAAQHVQNVADASALAGAAVLPDVHAANTRLQQMVQTNNQETPSYGVSMSPSSDVIFYNPGHTIVDYGLLEDDQHALQVTCHSTVEYMFAKVFGMQSATVTRSATALATARAGSGDGLFFAGATDPHVEGIRATGSGLTVEGSMHSNTRVTITGSGHDIEGDVQYLNGYQINDPSGIQGDIVEDEIRTYPVPYTWEQFDVGPWDYEEFGNVRINRGTLSPGRWRIHGDLTIKAGGAAVQDALIVADGDIRFNGSGAILDRVTLIAGGTITFNGAAERFSYYEDDLFAMSMSADERAIRINGANSDTRGIIYAPNGGVVYNGGNQEIHEGGVIALTITVHGAGSRFAGLGGGSGGRSYASVRLIR